MKIAINGRFLMQSVTGVQRVALEFVQALDEMLVAGEITNIEPRIILPNRGVCVNNLNLKAIPLIHYGRLSGHLWEQLELSRAVGADPLLCLGNLAPVIRLRSRNRPTVTIVHDLSYKYFPNAYDLKFRAFYNTIIPQVLKYSNHVVTVSKAEYESIIRYYPELEKQRRLSYYQNGGLPDFCSLDREVCVGIEKRKPVCLYVGSLTKRKNATNLFKAAVQLARQDGLDFVFIGSTGFSFEGVNLNVPNDVKVKFQFLGQVNDPKMIYEQYRMARVFLFPSFYEASPLPPIEAMALGCPVVTSKIPSLEERCGDAAEYCDPSNVQSIVSSVRKVIRSPKRWGDLQEKGFKCVSKYSWKDQAKYILMLLEKTL